jgi:hypothetical protein
MRGPLRQVRSVDQKLTRSDDPAALSGRHDCNLSRVAVATKSGRTFMRHSCLWCALIGWRFLRVDWVAA